MSPSESCTFAEGTQRQEDGDLRDDKHELTFLAWTEVNMQTPECTPGGSQCQSGVTSPFALEVFFELYLLPTFVYRKIAYSDHSLPISAFWSTAWVDASLDGGSPAVPRVKDHEIRMLWRMWGQAESWGWLQEAGLCGGPEGAAMGLALSGRIFICTWTWRDGAGLTGISRGGSPVSLGRGFGVCVARTVLPAVPVITNIQWPPRRGVVRSGNQLSGSQRPGVRVRATPRVSHSFSKWCPASWSVLPSFALCCVICSFHLQTHSCNIRHWGRISAPSSPKWLPPPPCLPLWRTAGPVGRPWEGEGWLCPQPLPLPSCPPKSFLTGWIL